VQHYFPASEEKRFLLGDVAQDLPVVTDIHVPTLARMLNTLRAGLQYIRTSISA